MTSSTARPALDHAASAGSCRRRPRRNQLLLLFSLTSLALLLSSKSGRNVFQMTLPFKVHKKVARKDIRVEKGGEGEGGENSFHLRSSETFTSSPPPTPSRLSVEMFPGRGMALVRRHWRHPAAFIHSATKIAHDIHALRT